MKRLWRQLYNERGFTLIELLVVVAILGILAAVAIPNLGRLTRRGHEESEATELGIVHNAVVAAMAAQGVNAVETGTLNNPPGHDLNCGGTTIGAFIVDGAGALHGTYTLDASGTITAHTYP